ncbi:MAG: hypothetical protein NZ480_03150, partial [Bdellovibrionaceae bacterium]|nr:hypothetical protein [Pseudobdellovibrionaceae bacterium]
WVNQTPDMAGLVDKSTNQTIGGQKTFSGNLTVGGTLSVNNTLTVGNQNALVLQEASSNGSDGISLRAPSSLSSSITFTLPSSTGTNGQVLSTDGSGNLSWITPSGGGGSPGGSSGHVQFNNGGSFGGDADFVWNNSSKRLGVKTASPQATVHVTGSVVSSANVVTSGATVNLAESNVHVLNSVGGSTITLQNMVHGGAYTIIVADTTSQQYTFSGCSQAFFSPANAPTTANTRTIFGIVTIQSGSDWHCYISWSTDFN